MITKFLYQMDSRNKRVITGVVQNDDILAYDPLHEYPMVLEDGYVPAQGETILDNYGTQYYCVFSNEKTFKYINFNDYLLKVKLALTDNVAFAATLSKNLMSVILEETGYFDCDDFEVNYVDSGLFLKKDLSYKDAYDGWFKKVDDDVYVELNYLNYPFFIGKKNNEYVLTDDFKDAFRVSKKECRNLLIAREFIDVDIKKRHVNFSHFNMFLSSKGYAFGGLNNFEVIYDDDILKINRDFKMTSDYRLVADKKRAAIIRDMMYLMKKPLEGKEAYLKVNGKYVKALGNHSYELTTDAARASALDFTAIDIIKKAITLFTDSANFEILHQKNYFLYTHLDSFELSKEIKEAIPSRLVSKELYEGFIEAFNNNNQNYLLMLDSKYVSFKLLSNLSFAISYEETAFNATRFNNEQIKILSNLFSVNFNKREITPIFDAAKLYNIKQTNAFYSLAEAYDAFKYMVKNLNIRVSDSILVKDIKTESDKGALEYLRRFYLKTIFDAYHLFKDVLSKENITNILLCGTTSTADLIGLSVAANELGQKVNIKTLETPKWGLYPIAYIAPEANYISSYRLSLASLDKEMLEEFDMIYIGKNFKEKASVMNDFINNLTCLDKDIVLLNTHLTKEYEISNNYFKGLYAIKEVNRKYLNYKDDLLNNLNKDSSSIVNPKSTYYSLVKISNHDIIDLLKKN